jgi:uncharacterized membrane protein YcaP (DUF421 family)
MKKEEIHLWDIKRILLGNAPPEFLLEVLIRTLIIYFVTLVIMRLLGKRMSGQLTIIELAVMVTMGAIISVPMQMPERGILQGILALVLALAFHRGINSLGLKSSKAESIIQGESSLLVKDGVLQLEEMKKANISKEQIFAGLRNKQIYSLGKVKRLYLEACGLFSIYEDAHAKPGLPVLPDGDDALLDLQPKAHGKVVCLNCGNPVQETEKGQSCVNCGNKEYTKAIG